jgi:hypothetical protein
MTSHRTGTDPTRPVQEKAMEARQSKSMCRRAQPDDSSDQPRIDQGAQGDGDAAES